MQSIRWENGKAVIPKIEFYINNTCNLTCNNCNRFNNHKFNGWQNFHDYEEDLKKWSEYITIEKLVIMGGEPLLNPSLIAWIEGLNKIFNKHVQILSNGLLLHKNKKLYHMLHRHNKHYNYIGISWHNPNHKQLLLEQLHSFMENPVCVSGNIDSNLKSGDQITFVDDNKVKILVWVQDEFYQAAVQKNYNGNFTLHNNDPTLAHSQCGFAQNKNYHLIKGKLYKCGPVALFPEFHEQNNFDLPQDDIDLLYAYKPLSVDEFQTKGKDFLNSIDDVLPQCKFCPVNLKPELIYPEVKGKSNQNK